MNNQQHEKIKKTLKVLGIVIAVFGAIFSIIGFVDFFIAFSNTSTPKLFFFAFIGLPLFGIGMMITVTGYRREIMTYQKNEGMPVVNEALDEMSPTISKVVNDVKSNENTIKCSCGQINDVTSKYCKSCGKELQVKCPHCGKIIDEDSAYCNHCGNKL